MAFSLLPKRFAQEHRADIGIAIAELQDAPGDGAAVIQQFGRTLSCCVVQGDRTGQRTQRRRHGARQRIDTRFQRLSCLWLKQQSAHAASL